jgi:hypothetical protein
MALEYSLRLAADCDPGLVAGLVAASRSVRGHRGTLQAPGVVEIRVVPESGHTHDTLRRSLGLTPTVLVFFRLDKFRGPSEGVTSVLQVCADVLHALPGDAVLLFNGETVVLLRQQGRLLLNRGWGGWSAVRPSELSLPSEWAELPPVV